MSSIIPQESIEQVKLASDIVEVVSGYLSLTRKGRNYFGLCPFHNEKTPSFSVNPEMQIFHCFGCGAGGNVFTFVMKIDGLTFPEAVRQLAQNAGILLPETDVNVEQYRAKEALFYVNKMANDYFNDNLLNHPKAEQARKYLNARGLEKADFEKYKIGYSLDEWDGLLKFAGKKSIDVQLLKKAGLVIEKNEGQYYDRFRGRITFAIQNISNQIVAFGARRIIDDESPKYINSPETDIYQKRFTLYGLNLTKEHIRNRGQIVFVEGYTDFISLHKKGISNVVATSGTSLTEDHARLIRRYTTNATLLFDSDSAGAAAAMRGADLLLENGFDVKIAQLPPGQDPDDFARANTVEELEKLVAGAQNLIDFKLDQLSRQRQFESVSQKVSATKEILASISRIEDQLIKTYWIKQLSSKLDLPEEILWLETQKLEKRTTRTPVQSQAISNSSENLFFQTRRGLAELSIFESIICNRDSIPLIIANLSGNDFVHTEIASIITQIEAENGLLTDDHLEKIVSSLEDPMLAQRASAVLYDEENVHTLARIIGYIKTVQLAQIDEEIAKLREELKYKKDETGNLLDSYRQLLRYRKEVDAGKYLNIEQ